MLRSLSIVRQLRTPALIAKAISSIQASMPLVLLSTILLAPVRAPAQYMYLDSNGDGINTAEDRLSASGPTSVDVWLDTMHDRNGSVTTCNSGSESLTINSYVFNLQLSGTGSFSYSGFINHIPEMTTPFGELNPGNGTYKNGAGGGAIFPPGIYHLASLSVTLIDGYGSLEIAPMVEGSADPTSFGSRCVGTNFDNTYTLDLLPDNAANLRYQSSASLSPEEGPWQAEESGTPKNRSSRS